MNGNVFFFDGKRFVPYDRRIHSKKVSNFWGFYVLGEKRNLFLAGSDEEQNKLIQEAEKVFINLLSTPFLCGKATEGCVMKADDICFSENKHNTLKNNPKVVVEIFGLTDLTRPENIET